MINNIIGRKRNIMSPLLEITSGHDKFLGEMLFFCTAILMFWAERKSKASIEVRVLRKNIL